MGGHGAFGGTSSRVVKVEINNSQIFLLYIIEHVDAVILCSFDGPGSWFHAMHQFGLQHHQRELFSFCLSASVTIMSFIQVHLLQ